MDFAPGSSSQTHRRTLLTAAVGLLAPVMARAQKRRRIGVLLPAFDPSWREWTLFLSTLRALGWNADNDLEWIVRVTGGDHSKLPALADELLSAGVDLILANDTLSAQTLVQRTKTVPIILVYSSDPVAAGLVSSLARPGGNVTGFSDDKIDLSAKLVQFMRELVPGLRRLAVLFNPEIQLSALSFHRVETLATAFGIETIGAAVAKSEQLEPAMAAVARGQPQILMVHSAPPIGLHSARIAEFAIRHGIATYCYQAFQVRAGGLLSYSPNDMEKHRRLAYYVDRILRGAAPSDLPIELTTYRLIVNLRTARALGLTIPPILLAQAEEEIE